jgi:hypothetical protein
MKTKNNIIIEEICETLNTDKFVGLEMSDLSDIGNLIGIIIGNHISNDIGYELIDLINGIKHGVSISTNTHE